MKTMITALILGISVQQSYGLLALGKTYGKDTPVGFEIFNKSPEGIWVAIKNGDTFIRPSKKLAGNTPGKFLKTSIAQYPIDIIKPTELAVWLSTPTFLAFNKTPEYLYFPGGWVPQPDYIFSFAKNKTIYLTWDKANYPRPQTGPLKGILGKTESGLNLSNNVTASEITQKYPKK